MMHPILLYVEEVLHDFNEAFIAGYKDSRINVVLPLPDIPVIVVRTPLGIEISSGLLFKVLKSLH